MRITRLAASLCASLALAGCVASPPPAPPARVAVRPPPVTRKAAAAPDWFQRQVAAARLARRQHLPHSDTAGAQLAYYKVMLPACRRVAASGPGKYRARCDSLVRQAAVDTPPPPDVFTCADATDETPEKATVCDD